MRKSTCTRSRAIRRNIHRSKAQAALLILGLLFAAPAATAAESPWQLRPGGLEPSEPSSPTSPWLTAEDTQPYPSSGNCDPHPGIRISEDEGARGFEWMNPTTGVREPRPGSGVTGGSGTQEDPYVISGWCIGPTGIHISDTRTPFIIRDNRITGTGLDGGAVGIRIENATHATLATNQITRSGHGIGAWDSQDIQINDNLLEDNLAYGAWVAQSQQVTIRDNVARSNENGLGIGLAHGALVSGNTAGQNTQSGILNAFSDDAEIQANTLAQNDVGIYVREAFDVVVADNTMDDHTGNGLAFDLSVRGIAQGNTVTGSGHEGIIFWSSPHGTAIDNEVTSNGFAGDRYGLRMAGSPNSTVQDNTAAENLHGIVLDGSPGSLVTGNLMQENEGDGLILWENPRTRVTHNAYTENAVGTRVIGDITELRINGNNLFANEIGLHAEDAAGVVDATGNWWGCPRGPGQDGCDTATGDADTSDWLRRPDRDAPEPGLGRKPVPAPGPRTP